MGSEERSKKTRSRIMLTSVFVGLYLALNCAAFSMLVSNEFIPHFFWISLAYAMLLIFPDVWTSRKLQKFLFKRIHKLVYADEAVIIAPGELPAARRSVISIPWVASARNLISWLISNFLFCMVVLPWYVMLTHDPLFPSSATYWFSAYLHVALWFAPLVLLAALLTNSAGTGTYVNFFFREGEYEKYWTALTSVRRRYLYMGLVGYTFFLIIAAINIKFVEHNLLTVEQAYSAIKDTELFGAGLLIAVCLQLFILQAQEARQKKRLPLMLEKSSKRIDAPDKRCPSCNLVVGAAIEVCPQDGTVLSFPDESASLATSYEFLEEIARGYMSVVYKARHRLLQRTVAIKMMDTRTISRIQAAQRFYNEARAASRLDHPNIVSVWDFGQFDSEKWFLVMEYIEGTTLANLIASQKGKLPVRDSLLIFDQICQAMQYAHEQKILHRDLKPGNIMVSSENLSYTKYNVKVVDFGIAKMLEGTTEPLTKSGDVFGTPDYMSPEQSLGHPLDARSDIYSMGCLMYESLTGIRPLSGDSPLATMYKHMNQQPEPMAQHREELSQFAGLDTVVLKTMSKSPDDRYHSFALLRTALQKAGTNEPSHAPPAH